ncbi:MAG: D-alanyl-D-alanine carboxypeptidase/D-alanyl-D-alanine-endopeptidase [Bacteroidota bacterium]|nr:D-alanyl-D-alanine carboxypeptidase/D-alanyl-D-alanine-endopeptidase [Bacteroidota bacterium]
MNRCLLAFSILLMQGAAYACVSVKPFKQPGYQHETVSLCIREAESHQDVMQENEHQCVMPASVMKLVTTATALELLGLDHRFETKLLYSGQLTEGQLTGDIIIKGGGDPELGSRHMGKQAEAFLTDWVNWIVQSGIKVIKGNIIADPSLFDDEPVSPYWLWEDIGNYYAAGIYGLGIYDNSFTLTLKSGAPGTQPEIVAVSPALPGLTIENQLLAADNSKDSAYFYGVPYQWNRVLRGTIPAYQQAFSIRGDLPDPPAFTARLLYDALTKAGVRIEGTARSARSDLNQLPSASGCTLLGVTQSEPLSKLIGLIHEYSDNIYTEYLLRHIALTEGNQPASARNGLRVIRDYWAKKGLDVTGLYMVDGCGLSPLNRVSSSFIADLLDYMLNKSQYASVFEQSLPLAGIQGTVSGFLKETPLAGKIRLKSGSNRTTTAYAGYYRQKRQTLIVVMLVNHTQVSSKQVRNDMKELLLTL